jgi:hypothetical protein
MHFDIAQQEYLKKCIEYCKIPESKLITDNAFLEDEFGVPITYYDAGLDLHLAPGTINQDLLFVYSRNLTKYNVHRGNRSLCRISTQVGTCFLATQRQIQLHRDIGCGQIEK